SLGHPDASRPSHSFPLSSSIDLLRDALEDTVSLLPFFLPFFLPSITPHHTTPNPPPQIPRLITRTLQYITSRGGESKIPRSTTDIRRQAGEPKERTSNSR
ncbi:unnamed protein product, partial [Tuber aestivum]